MMKKRNRVIAVIMAMALVASMFVVAAISASAADGDYYVTGSFTDPAWEAGATDHPLLDNGDGTYSITVDIAEAGNFKVVDAAGKWYPEGMGNDKALAEAGTYEITFDPAPFADDPQSEGGFTIVKQGEPEPSSSTDEPSSSTDEPSSSTDEPSSSTAEPKEDVALISVNGGPAKEYKVGETVTLTVAVTGNDMDVCAYNASVYYDRNGLTLDEKASLFPAVGEIINDNGDRASITKLCNYNAKDDNGEDLISFNGFLSTGLSIDLEKDNRLGVFTFTVTEAGEFDIAVVMEELLGEDANGDNVDVNYDEDKFATLSDPAKEEETTEETTADEEESTTGSEGTTGGSEGTTGSETTTAGSGGSVKPTTGGSNGKGTVTTGAASAIAFVSVLVLAVGAIVVSRKRSMI